MVVLNRMQHIYIDDNEGLLWFIFVLRLGTTFKYSKFEPLTTFCQDAVMNVFTRLSVQ